MKNSRQIILTLLLIVIGSWGIVNIFRGNFYTNHDGYTHTARIAKYFTAFTDGQMPPRWAGNLNSGFGSPIFVFSYPLPYIFGSILHFLGFSFTDAFKIIVGGSFLISGVFMYWFLKEFFKDFAAFTGAVFYIFAPYQFLNIYVRGSLSESLAYMMVPLVFFAITKLWKSKSSYWIIFASCSLSFLLLSQYLVAAIFLPVYVLFTLILLVSSRKSSFLYKVVVVLILGFGLSAASYVPVFFERRFIRFSESITYYATHFVSPSQLIRSPWGYGFSFPGVNDGMSFQIGLVHLLVVSMSFVFFLLYLFKKKKKNTESTLQFYLLLLSYALFFSAVILMVEIPITKFLWQKIPFLTTIDLPWRFLGLTVFTISIIAAYVAQRLHSKVLIVALILLLLYANRNHIRVNLYLSYPDEEFLFYQGTATWVNEYTPVWRSSTKFQENDVRYSLRGDVTAEQIESKSNKLVLNVSAVEGSVVRLNIFYFPGWKIYRDGQQLTEHYGYSITTIDDGIKDGPDESGLIDVVVPKGSHTIVAKFTETPIRKVGNGISLVSLGVLSLIPVLLSLCNSKRQQS